MSEMCVYEVSVSSNGTIRCIPVKDACFCEYMRYAKISRDTVDRWRLFWCAYVQMINEQRQIIRSASIGRHPDDVPPNITRGEN